MKESALRTKIKKALEAEGCFVAVIHQAGYSIKGLSDLVGCLPNGRFFSLEVKVPGRENTLTPRQIHVLRTIRKHKGIAEMVTSVDDALEALGLS